MGARADWGTFDTMGAVPERNVSRKKPPSGCGTSPSAWMTSCASPLGGRHPAGAILPGNPEGWCPLRSEQR